MIKYLFCLLRFHHPIRFYYWDMVGDPNVDGWNVYKCPKCGEWRDK